VNFIKQEALEKAKEIKLKADEEFNIEKVTVRGCEKTTLDYRF
jgi:V-type H+-transporting ATPase subunit E